MNVALALTFVTIMLSVRIQLVHIIVHATLGILETVEFVQVYTL